MDLKSFTAKAVSPGEPITAQSWNELVDGIKELNEFMRNNQATSLRVALGNADGGRQCCAAAPIEVGTITPAGIAGHGDP